MSQFLIRFSKARDTLGLITPLFRKHRYRLFFGFLSLLGVDLLQLLVPRVIKSGVDSIQNSTASSNSLLLHGLVIIGFALGVDQLRQLGRR